MGRQRTHRSIMVVAITIQTMEVKLAEITSSHHLRDHPQVKIRKVSAVSLRAFSPTSFIKRREVRKMAQTRVVEVPRIA